MVELNRDGPWKKAPYLKEVETSRIHINQNLSRACCGFWNVSGERDIGRVSELFHDECPHGGALS